MKSDLHNVIKDRKALYVRYNIKQGEAEMRKDESNMENGHKLYKRLRKDFSPSTLKTLWRRQISGIQGDGKNYVLTAKI